MDVVAQPPPYLGVNEQIPKAVIQSPYCETLKNFNPDAGTASLRHGDAVYKRVGNDGVLYTELALDSYADSKLFAFVYRADTNKLEAWDTGAGTFEEFENGSPAAVDPAMGIQSLQFNNHLFWFDGSDDYPPGVVYDGSSWALIGYVDEDDDPFPAFGGNSFNHRAFLIIPGTAGYRYSEGDAISGPCHLVDLATVVTDVTTLSTIASVTIADNISAVRLQAFVFFSGEVIFYSGSYPDGTDWGEVGRAKIGQPLNYGSGMAYQGDYLVFCESGVISLRDLFLKGSAGAQQLSVNGRITQGWHDVVRGYRALLTKPAGQLRGIKGVYDSINDRIIISFPVAIDASGVASYDANTLFVYNGQLQSWYYHESVGASGFPVYDLTVHQGKVYFVACGESLATIWEKEGAASFVDRNIDNASDTGFHYEIVSAPLATARSTGYLRKVKGFEPIIRTDQHTQTNYALRRDLGVEDSAAQQLPSDSPITLQKTFVDVGLEGTYVQWMLSGTTVVGAGPVGLELYGVNIWLDEGTRPR